MVNTYKIGNTPTTITLIADINTIGLATTRAIAVDVNGTTNISVAHSVDATGDIKVQPIGDNGLLQGKRLTVFTQIALSGNDEVALKIQADNATGAYTLNGGEAGLQIFNNPQKTVDGRNVFLNFLVDLQ